MNGSFGSLFADDYLGAAFFAAGTLLDAYLTGATESAAYFLSPKSDLLLEIKAKTSPLVTYPFGPVGLTSEGITRKDLIQKPAAGDILIVYACRI